MKQNIMEGYNIGDTMFDPLEKKKREKKDEPEMEFLKNLGECLGWHIFTFNAYYDTIQGSWFIQQSYKMMFGLLTLQPFLKYFLLGVPYFYRKISNGSQHPKRSHDNQRLEVG